jgi:alkanesulfonate monooxygenase SsuD/methylene tetrahydromethanopterin reductase-like flavin-dependent oxidoreductase (luciferase family)
VVAIESLAFLTPGNFADDAPRRGLEDTLELFELAERLGFDGAWVRQRHLEHGVSSAAVFLAAATQRTRRIELGVAVIPIGYESPFRLAEDLSLADVLSGGRLQPGFSAGVPPHAELMAALVHDTDDWRSLDVSHGRVERLIQHLRSEHLGGPDTVIHSPGNVQRPRLQPHSPGLAERVWYGAGSIRSAQWAGHRGVHLLLGNVSTAERTEDFVTSQLHQLAAHRDGLAGRRRRVAVGRVVIPTDSATRAQRRRYEEYGASRHERTLAPQLLGGRPVLFARDVIGTTDEIVERLRSDPVLADEFDIDDYRQILADVVEGVAPALGWSPVGPERLVEQAS